jgi:hypothetical protein
MSDTVQMLLVHGGRISHETAKQIVEWFEKYGPDDPPEDYESGEA